MAPFKWLSNSYIFQKYSKDPGNMLVHTGVIGWFLSSAAQIFAIAINDQLSPKEKMFLIPQEIADAVVNCVSFYTFTNGVKYIGKKLTNTGKLRNKAVSEILKDRGLILEKGQQRLDGKVYAGDWNFDITKLDGYKEHIEKDFKPFNNGVEVATGLVGSIISSNLITPIFRNYYAAHKQKSLVARTEAKQEIKQDAKPLPPKTESAPINAPQVSFANYQKMAYSRTFSGLKI